MPQTPANPAQPAPLQAAPEQPGPLQAAPQRAEVAQPVSVQRDAMQPAFHPASPEPAALPPSPEQTSPAQVLAALRAACFDLPLPAYAQLIFGPVRADWAARAQGALPASLERAMPKRQAEFMAGRLAAQQALVAAGLAGAAMPGIRADHLPLWPRGWLGSISHCAEIAAAVVTPATPGRVLGLDIEPVMTSDLAQEVAAFIMPEAELGQVGLPIGLELTRVFSAKEALFKALYPQIRCIKEFSAATVRWQGREIRLRLSEDWGAAWPQGTELAVTQRHVAGHVLSLLCHAE